MCDADLSTPIAELPRLLARLDEGHDVAIGSRALPDSKVEVRQPLYRESMGRLYNRLVRLLLLSGLHDTQCGFKLFTANAARLSFEPGAARRVLLRRREPLHRRRRGLKIAEVAVTWRNDAASRVGMARGALAFFDLLRIRGNDLPRTLRGQRPSGVVADLGGRAQLLDPSLDAGVEVPPDQLLAERRRRLCERGRVGGAGRTGHRRLREPPRRKPGPGGGSAGSRTGG